MTVIRTDYEVEYEIGDVYPSTFPFEFGVVNASHIKTYDIDPALAPTDDAYRTLVANAKVTPNLSGIASGGYVTTPTKLAVGHVLLIRRETPAVQNQSYQTQREMQPKSVEQALDYLTFLVQETASKSDIEGFADSLADLLAQINDLATSKADRAELNSAVTVLENALDALKDNTVEVAVFDRVVSDINQTLDDLNRVKANAADVEAALEKKADADAVALLIQSLTNRIEALESGKLDDAPKDGLVYGRKDGEWVEVSEASGGVDPGYFALSGNTRLLSSASSAPDGTSDGFFTRSGSALLLNATASIAENSYFKIEGNTLYLKGVAS